MESVCCAWIFVATVVLPVLEYWSPNFSIWVFKRFGIVIPLFAWLVLAAGGGAIAGAIATPQRRFRKVGAISGIIGALGAFGLTWSYFRLMTFFRRESVLSGEIIFVTFLGILPGWYLYEVLQQRRRHRNSALGTGQFFQEE